MMAAAAPATARRPSFVVALAAATLGIAIIGAWQLGVAMRPNSADVAAERQAAYQQAYDDAHADAAQAAYARAWDPAFERGAAEGTRDGTAAGVASVPAAS